jgi:hypothetical protein
MNAEIAALPAPLAACAVAVAGDDRRLGDLVADSAAEAAAGERNSVGAKP